MGDIQQPQMDGRCIDSVLTSRIKRFALKELKADLVGIANIERFAKAPLRMSPQGILPSARSVVVMAIHHPDACIEMGGMTHPQDIGPYRVQCVMNDRLDEISYRMALFLEDEGFASIPIVSSNIWRYKGYKDLTAHFAPDISHIHAAVAAGLAEHGYSGLAITPEYGARQRYVSVITDAVLEPTPLLTPGSVCDMCRLCVKHCMSKALSKEVDGLNVVEIEDKRYTYANKNLWRCAWGEHFDLDLNLPIPEHVDEKVILEQVQLHGQRIGEMGSCLRYCVPKPRRYFDSDYTNAPRRKRNAIPTDDAGHRGFVEKLEALAYGQGVEYVMVTPAETLVAQGIDIKQYLPDGAVAVTLGLHYPRPTGSDPTAWARGYLLEAAAYDVARALEDRGYSAVCNTAFPEGKFQAQIEGVRPGWVLQTSTVITAAPLPATERVLPNAATPCLNPAQTRAQAERLLKEMGADLVGVAPAERLAALRPQLADLFEGEEILAAHDRSKHAQPYDPVVRVDKIHIRTPEEYVPGAKSVLVFGMRMPHAAVERTALEPAEAVGPYAFAQFETSHLLTLMAYRITRWLLDHGYQAKVTQDLCGDGSGVATPRGEQPDAFANRFAAVAAGLGRLTKAGFVYTPQFGANMRFIAIVTDAELPANAVSTDTTAATACAGCDRCIKACRTHAFVKEASVTVDGVTENFTTLNHKRCDWAKRYSLIGEEGTNYVGWNIHLPAPEKIDAETLADGLRQQPPIPKHRPCNFEACVLSCPLVR